jgi:arylsulfatase A-like enzyme
MVDKLDWNTGRLLEAFAEERIAEDTIVMFTSDNGGPATSEGRFLGWARRACRVWRPARRRG